MATKKKTSSSKKASAKKQKLIDQSNSHKALALAFFGIAIFFIVIVGFALLSKNITPAKKGFESLEYDIIVEKHRYEYEGLPAGEIPETGYSTNYYYVVVNSTLHEKYTLKYEDVWEVHNERGDYDTLTISTETISDEDLDNLIEQYGKNSHLLKVKDFFEADVKEEYIVKGNSEYEVYLVEREKFYSEDEETNKE